MVKIPTFPNIWKSLKVTFKEIYHSLGFTTITSSIWFICYLPILVVTLSTANYLISPQFKGHPITDAAAFAPSLFLLITIWNGLLAGPVTTAIYGMYQVRKEELVNVRTFFTMFKKFYWRSACVHWISSLITTMFVFNVTIAVRRGGFAIIIAGIISIYSWFFLTLMTAYYNPLLYLDNKITKVLRKSFLITLDNFAFSFWQGLILAVLFCFCLVVSFLLILVYGAFLIYFVNSNFDIIYNRYESEPTFDTGGQSNG